MNQFKKFEPEINLNHNTYNYSLQPQNVKVPILGDFYAI